MRVYPKVSGLAAWSEIFKWYISLPLDAVVSLFCEFSLHKPICCFSTVLIVVVAVYFVIDSVRKLLVTPSYVMTVYRKEFRSTYPEIEKETKTKTKTPR
jgi:hypothetical protein